ncbi:MAG TPA: TolC family protein [Candidatus Eisenbacteria bacterium]
MQLRFSVPLSTLLLMMFVPDARALTLEEAIHRALERNERGLAAGETAEAARARVARARSFLLPELTATGDWTRRSHETTRTVDGVTSVLSTRDGLEGRLSLNQVIFDARAFPLLREAKHSRDAAEFDAVEVRRQLAFDTAEIYLTVLAGEQVVRAAGERRDLADQNTREVRVRFGAQLVSSNDVSRAELESAVAERELVEARGAVRVARLALSHLLDQPVTDSLEVPMTLLHGATEVPPMADVPDGTAPTDTAAVDRRPDVLASRSRVEALEAAADEPTARYLPQVNFNAQGWATNEAGFGGRGEDWNLGLGLTWPIFDGGDREAAKSERDALARAGALDLKNQERGVAVEIASARVAVESRQATLTQSDVAVQAARRNAAESAELYRRGLIRALEAVDANVQLFEAEVEKTRAQFTLALAWLDLKAALGYDPLTETGIP